MFCQVLTSGSRDALFAVLQTPTTDTRETAGVVFETQAGLQSIERLIPLYGDFLFGLVLPALLVLWLGKVALGARTWPPWEVFRR